ncbi:ATP-binding protein [candidate division KSB3 bacterium]|uniref:ATP-binding protein n=1 Tax=candidate division KSB3 bacterium TaxID=2044937 RepID=A0A9D5JUU5_9BACT|nr:ATP-binding protein [candidate division KSB3 bacterium]MBD3324529.1 ATP-binding protein [candidate division KSB3 bacterium]
MEEVTLKIPSNTQFVGPVIQFVSSLFNEKEVDESAVSNVVTSVMEALGNAIVHGNGSDRTKSIELLLQIDNHRIHIEVQDEGSGFDINALSDPLTPENLLKSDGRGIFLIRTLMDRVSLDVNGRGTTLCMEKEFVHALE